MVNEPHWVKKGDSKDPTLTDMLVFYRSVDWAEWWDAFYLKRDKHGRYLYGSIHSFARTHSKNRLQFEFLLWYIGPKLDHLTGKPVVPYSDTFTFVTPQAWWEVRRSGGWHTDVQTKEFNKRLAIERDALEAMREVGQQIVLPGINRYEKMAEAWDRMMNFGEPNPDLTDKENQKRFMMYTAGHAQIESLKGRALDWFFKTRGVNVDQPSAFTEMVSIQALIAQRGGETKISRTQVMLNRIMEMTLAKHAEYGIPLPDEIKSKVLEVAVEPVPDDKKKIQ